MDEQKEQPVKQDTDEVLSVFLANLQSCENNREPHDRDCKEIEDLAANRFDWSHKADWQSKNAIPKFASNREKFAAVMQKALVQAPDFFAVETRPGSQFKDFAPNVKKWLKYRLDREGFATKFALGSKIAATRGRMYFKPYYASELVEQLVWKKEEQPVLDAEGMPAFDPVTQEPITNIVSQGPQWETVLEKNLRISLVNPEWVWHDPSGRNRFIIEEYKISYGELLALAEAGHYDKDEVAKIAAMGNGEEPEDEERRIRIGEGDPGNPPSLNEVILHEFWGDLYSPEGKLVKKNCTFTVANRQFVVRKPVKNPYWHGKFPYVWGAPVLVPFSNYDKSFLSDARGLQRAETEFFNLFLDNAKYAVAGAFTVDIEQLVNPNDIKGGIRPGIVVKKKGSYSNGSEMIESVKLNTIDPMTPTVVQMIDRYGQLSTGINDLMMGVVSGRRATATEQSMRLQEGNSLFDTYARNLEDQLIGPLVEQIWALDLQYFDFTDPEAREILGDFADILANMTDEQRYELIKQFEFRGKGLSLVLEKAAELDKIDRFLRAFGRYFAEKYDSEPILRKAFEALGWDPKELLKPLPAMPPQQNASNGGPPQGGLPNLQAMMQNPQMLQQMMGGMG